MINIFSATTSPFPELKHKIIHPRPYHSKHHHEHHLGPFFEEPLNASSGALMVGVHLATDAVLNCRVGMLKDKTVNTLLFYFIKLILFFLYYRFMFYIKLFSGVLKFIRI